MKRAEISPESAAVVDEYVEGLLAGRVLAPDEFLARVPPADQAAVDEAMQGADDMVACTHPGLAPVTRRMQERVNLRIRGLQARRRRMADLRAWLQQQGNRAADLAAALRERLGQPAGTRPAVFARGGQRLMRSLLAREAASDFGLKYLTARAADDDSVFTRFSTSESSMRQTAARQDHADWLTDGPMGDPVQALDAAYGLIADDTLSRFELLEAPIDLDALAEALGLVVQEAAIEGCEGCLVTDDEIGAIVIDTRMPNHHRKRFTLAHEIAHFLLHVDLALIRDTHDTLSDYVTQIELEANIMAGRLLVPPSLLGAREATEPGFATAERLSDRFDISLQAAFRRILLDTASGAAFVTSVGGRTEQFVVSGPLGLAALALGVPLPAESAAAQMQGADVAVGVEREAEYPARDWFPQAGANAHVHETSRRMEGGRVYTLLTLLDG